MSSDDSLLLALFHDFYGEVIRLKAWVRGERLPAEGDGISAGQVGGGAVGADAVRLRLLGLLKRQAAVAETSGGALGLEQYRKAQFVMAALADETFLHLDWEGREVWEQSLLEAELFGTHRAGELFFTQLEELLQLRDPGSLDLARIYLLALALGFEGRYRGHPEAERELTAYRRRLYRFLFGRDVPKQDTGLSQLVPQAYAHTIDQGRPASLPFMRYWVLALVALLAGWILLSIPLWRNLVRELTRLLEDIPV